MVWNLNKVAESNNYDTESVEKVDAKSEKDLRDFTKYYENASDKEKKDLDEKFRRYLDDELKKDSDLKNKLSSHEIKESSEINEQDIANLNTVRNLTDVLNNYPNISSPEYRAIKKMLDEHIQDLSKIVGKTLANSESAE